MRKQQYIEFEFERFGTKRGKVIDVRDGYLVVLIENEKRGTEVIKEQVVHVDMLFHEFRFTDALVEYGIVDRKMR